MDLGNNPNKEPNSVQLLFNYKTTSKEFYELLSFQMNCEMTFQNIFENESLVALDKFPGYRFPSFFFSVKPQDDRADEVYHKLNDDLERVDLICLNKTTGPTISIGETHSIIIYTINQKRFSKVSTLALSDGID